MPELKQTFNPSELEDDKLVLAHATLHFYWRDLAAGRGVDEWSEDEILQKHREVVSEMKERGIEHEYMNELDAETAQAIQMKVTQMETSEAEEWAKNFLSSEEKGEFIKDNTPDADWIVEAVEFIKEEDSNLDLSDYMSFTPIEQLSDWQEEFIKENVEQENPDVFRAHKEDGTKILLTQEDEYKVYVDDEVVLQSENIKESLREFTTQKEQINIEQQDEDWVVPSNPEDYDLADPDTEWNGDDITVSAYADEFGYDDNAGWEDFTDEERRTATSHHSASASGNPADNFEDLWGAHHLTDGTVVLNGVNAAKAANSGARSEPNTPLDIRDDIESHLNSHQEEFEEEFEELEQAAVTSDRGVEDGRWYIWDIDQAIEWANDHGFETGIRTLEDNFVSFVQIPEENLDEDVELTAVWRGETWRPDYFIQEIDDLPVLFSMVENEDGISTEVQAVKFQIRPSGEIPTDTQDLQQEAIMSDVAYHWYVWDEEEAEEFIEQEFDEDYEVKQDGVFTTFVFNSDVEDTEVGWVGSPDEPDEEPTTEDLPKQLVFSGSDIVSIRLQTEEPKDKEALVQ